MNFSTPYMVTSLACFKLVGKKKLKIYIFSVEGFLPES